MPEPQMSVEVFVIAAAKILPAAAGAFISLKWVPGNTLPQRLTNVIGGIAAAYILAPAITEWAGFNSSNVGSAISFAIGLFGVTVFHEIHNAITGIGAGKLLRDYLRKKLGLDRDAE